MNELYVCIVYTCVYHKISHLKEPIGIDGDGCGGGNGVGGGDVSGCA